MKYGKFCGTGGSITWYIAGVLFNNTQLLHSEVYLIASDVFTSRNLA